MIAGIGTDIVEIERIRAAVNKWGDAFLKRIFSESEISYCFSKRDPFPNLAARFAAKEAAIKALSGLIVDRNIHVGEIEVLNEDSGKPFIVLAGRIKGLIDSRSSCISRSPTSADMPSRWSLQKNRNQ